MAGGLVSVAIVVSVALQIWPSDGLTTTDALARSQVAEDEVLAQLTEGKVLHQKVLSYTRQGDAAATVRTRSTEWYLPERYISELWLEAGPNGQIAHVRGQVKGASGEVLQDITTVGAEVVTRDLESGAEARTPLEGLLVAEAVGRAAALKATMQAEVAAGKAAIASEGLLDGRRTMKIDQQLEVPRPIEGEGYALPYVEDIPGIRELRRRTDVDAQTFMPLRWSIIAVDTQDVEYVIEEFHRVAFEVIERSQVPVEP
ncbi:MAG TPA: hypothetical protein VFP63_01375 [Dehalococcoidia bacterium]|nr:hypothetical protein [Dehalococcoidia bacterium]